MHIHSYVWLYICVCDFLYIWVYIMYIFYLYFIYVYIKYMCVIMRMCICIYIITYHKCTAQRIFVKLTQAYNQCSEQEPEHHQHPEALLIPSFPLPIPTKGNHSSDRLVLLIFALFINEVLQYILSDVWLLSLYKFFRVIHIATYSCSFFHSYCCIIFHSVTILCHMVKYSTVDSICVFSSFCQPGCF